MIKIRTRANLLTVLFTKSYPAEIASVGQDSTQTPQSWHFSGSIQCLPSFSEIASNEQLLTQEPQFTQESLILWAIFYLSHVICIKLPYISAICKLFRYPDIRRAAAFCPCACPAVKTPQESASEPLRVSPAGNYGKCFYSGAGGAGARAKGFTRVRG